MSIKQEKYVVCTLRERTVNEITYKKHGGFIFSWEEIIKRKTGKHELILSIYSNDKPDKIFYNGKEVKIINI